MSAGHANSSSSSSRPFPSTTTTQACAACKYQRRKCNADCALAPYFPADHQWQFLNAHRLFGVSNILKIIKNLDPVQQSAAMNTIIFQSDARACDPVGGCYRIIQNLERKCHYLSAELAIVMGQLQMYRNQQQQMMPMPQNVDESVYRDNLMMAQHLQQQQQCYDYLCLDGNNIENEDDMNFTHIQNDQNVGSVDGNEVDMESMLTLQHLHGQQDDVKPFVDMFDMANALEMNDNKEQEMGETMSKTTDLDLASTSNYHCSSEVIQAKGANPREYAIQEHDLKGAASLFTLTSRDSSYV